MFDDLKTGSLEFASIDGGAEFAVFTDIDGDRQPIVPSLDAWIKCWEGMGKEMGFEVDQADLRALVTRLEGADPQVTQEQIAAARKVEEDAALAEKKTETTDEFLAGLDAEDELPM